MLGWWETGFESVMSIISSLLLESYRLVMNHLNGAKTEEGVIGGLIPCYLYPESCHLY